MELWLQAAGVLVGLALLWVGLRKLELSRPWAAVLGVLDVLVLVVSVATLGWLGLVLAAAASIAAILGWSIRLAMQLEEILVYAAIQADTSKDDMKQLHRRLKSSHRAFQQLGPIESARLISLLSQRARSADEIDQMALPIALLWVIHRPELKWLVERFDRIMRLYSKPPGAAMEVADAITATTRRSAATFDEIIDGMISAVSLP
jgi:hypothetical protein